MSNPIVLNNQEATALLSSEQAMSQPMVIKIPRLPKNTGRFGMFSIGILCFLVGMTFGGVKTAWHYSDAINGTTAVQTAESPAKK